MEVYIELLQLLENYFGKKDWKKYFLQGGCYWFADYLHKRIRNSVLMINRQEEHCAIRLEDGVYDVRGKISSYGFHPATEREIVFMRKNYVPQFDVEALEEYMKKNTMDFYL